MEPPRGGQSPFSHAQSSSTTSAPPTPSSTSASPYSSSSSATSSAILMPPEGPPSYAPLLSGSRAVRDLSSLPLPPTLRAKLLGAGFRETSDLHSMRPSDLSRELKISVDEAFQILKTVKDNSSQGSHRNVVEGKTAFDMINEQAGGLGSGRDGRKAIPTLCEAIDTMLGDGIPIAQLTEFCGVPGIGKTQVGMQLAVSVQIPKAFDGSEGECVYIDTEGSFVVERVEEMADAVIRWLQQEAEQGEETSNERKEAAAALSVEGMLNRIHYFRVYDYVEQVALSITLANFVREHPQVQIVIIDSIAFHFRHFQDFALRTRLLNNMSQALISLAEERQLAVVLINQVTTKLREGPNLDPFGSGNGTLTPALGESWGHTCTNRIILYWRDGQRLAHLLKCPSMESRTVPYLVSRDGVRDIPAVQAV